MSDSIPEVSNKPSREGTWARPVDHLDSSQVQGGVNINVDGKQLAGPLRGFGQLWKKTYSIRLNQGDLTPQQVVETWRTRFPQYWPKGNRFYGPQAGIASGSVAVLNLAGPGGVTAPGGRPLVSTGILVIYTDDESFSFMTPEGHIFGGMITFSAHADEGIVAQIQALIRANDPLYELGLRLGVIHKSEDKFWRHILKNLAADFGQQVEVQQVNVLIDPSVQWPQAGNIWQNAAIRTGIYLAMTPVRWAGSLFKK
jgi:hypothetical protein